jgi:hypothetical protein
MIFLGTTSVGSDVIKPTKADTLHSVDVTNLYINDLYVSSNPDYNIMPGDLTWDMNTIFWATFKGNLLAGNILIPISAITSMRIKVREYGKTLWTTIYEYEINSEEDFDFAKTYYFLKGNKTVYEIAIVPVLNNIESSYITNTVVSDFDGCYLCTQTKQYKAFINLSLEVTSNQSREFITTLGRKKPFVVTNGASQYDTISMSASFIPMVNCELDVNNAASYRREVIDFLSENKSIVLKDEQGKRWLVSAGGTIAQSVDGHPDNIVCNIEFTEVGDCDSTTDLFNAGLSDVDVEGV